MYQEKNNINDEHKKKATSNNAKKILVQEKAIIFSIAIK